MILFFENFEAQNIFYKYIDNCYCFLDFPAKKSEKNHFLRMQIFTVYSSGFTTFKNASFFKVNRCYLSMNIVSAAVS